MSANKPKFCRHDRFYWDGDVGKVVPGGFTPPPGVKLLSAKALGFLPKFQRPAYRARSALAAAQRKNQQRKSSEASNP